MPTEAELAAIAAALSVVLEAPVAVQPTAAPSAWAQASRREGLGMGAVSERAGLRGLLAP